jgi:excisionase family DNA binding protein
MDSLMTTEAAAAELAVKPSTLARWRRQGRGPRYVRIGSKVVRYRAADVNRWLEKHLASKRLSKHVA